MTLEQKILAKIKTEHLKPLSREYFRLRDRVRWILLALFVGGLGVGFGMIIYSFMSTDLSVISKLELSTSEKILFSFPFFWIASCIGIGTVAFINLRRTRKGYKISGRQFLVIAILISIGVGSILYALNVAQYLSRIANNKIPLYNDITAPDTENWSDPRRGLLSGVVRSKDSNEQFTIRDAEAVLWYVTGDDIMLPEGYDIQPGERVKMIGKMTGDDTFTAREVHPWVK